MIKILLLAASAALVTTGPAMAQDATAATDVADQGMTDQSAMTAEGVAQDLAVPAAEQETAEPAEGDQGASDQATADQTAADQTAPDQAPADQAAADQGASVQGMSGPESVQDAAVEAAMNKNNVMTVRNVTRTELVRGLPIFDAGGKPVGTVDRLSGNDVVIANGSREYSVPITEFFAYNQYGKDYFATRQAKATLETQASSSSAKPLAVVN